MWVNNLLKVITHRKHRRDFNLQPTDPEADTFWWPSSWIDNFLQERHRRNHTNKAINYSVDHSANRPTVRDLTPVFASWLVRDLSSPRIDQSAIWFVRELTSNPCADPRSF